MADMEHTGEPSIKSIRDCANAIWSCDTLDKATAFIQSLPSQFAPIALPNYVAGELKSPSLPTTTYVDSFEPRTGRVLYSLPCTPANDVEEAIQHARSAFRTWSKTSRAERSRHLRRVSELLQEHRELFAVWESIDQGKTLERARVEVDRAISNFSWVIP
jgi:acyl-CoA reductase-like NAD-dependent aldehyde dehydrogenase